MQVTSSDAQARINELTTLLTASASIIGIIISAIITYFLTKRREAELEWRKLKLSHYQEFMNALSGIVTNRSSPENQARFADARNAMNLVAPPRVLTKLRAFGDQISPRAHPNIEEHDRLLSDLLRSMRRDIHPQTPRDSRDFMFSLLDVGPAAPHTSIEP
jgi:hypothetical protein